MHDGAPTLDSATAVASNPAAAAPALGSLLAERYEIAESLAQGGIGAVCRARDRVLAENVAIRLARAERQVDEETADRLRSQGALAKRIAHPSVGRVHEYGWVGAVCFVSMELLEGRSLRDELESRPSGYPPGEALDICLQVARGLQAIHEAGVIHRDVKPACAVRDVSGAVRVTGFGIPLPPVRDPQVGTAVAGPRSATPEYMSPEECLGRAADQRSEIYALGILCYELFTGQPPFWGESLAATLLQQLEDPPPFETQQGRRVPPRIRPVLARALAKSPGDRYGTVREFADALRRAGLGGATPHEAGEVGSSTPNAAAAATPPGAGSDPPDRDRRRESRLKVPLDLRIRKLDPNGGVVREERTVAEDLSRGGARILTSIGPFSLGDRVEIEQVGGAFACLAEVRNRMVGPDGICRLGVSFIDCHAPSELVGDLAAPVPVGSAASASRSARQPAPAVGSPATAERALRILAAFEKLSEKDHFEVLGVPRTVSDAELKRAYAARAREYHPDAARDPMIGALSRELNALFIRAGEAYEALRNPVRRRDYAARLPPAVEPFPVAVPATPLGSASVGAESGCAEPTPAQRAAPSEQEAGAAAEAVVAEARELLAAERFWDVIVLLERELPNAPSPLLRHRMRILLARATVRNPNWVKRGEAILRGVLGEDPENVEAHLALARLYVAQGLPARGRRFLARVLELKPDHREAASELKALGEG